MTSPLVSVDWLHKNLSNVTVIDATWFMPNAPQSGRQHWQQKRLPNAIFFDFDAIADRSQDLPHMLPSPKEFEQAVGKLGISEQDTLVIYDAQGIFSAPRVWWMFTIMGHQKVFVLDGGLPAWQAAGYEVVSGEAAPHPEKHYHAHYQPNWYQTAQDVQNALQDPTYKVVDARASERFYGKVAEPRAELRSGHMPNAVNLPFGELLENGHYRDLETLQKAFAAISQEAETQWIFTCGSGVTACILALAAQAAGIKNLSVYDGSWSEWGKESRYPVVSCK